MPKLFLIPIISVFDVHDAALRDWLGKLDDAAILHHLEYPFRLSRFFPESSRRALASADRAHSEVLRLLDIINPDAVLLDISIDFIELENRYNKRLISTKQFWAEYYETFTPVKGSQAIYNIYIEGIIDKIGRLIESKDRLPLNLVFYGLDIKLREKLIPVYEEAFGKDGEFSLQAARIVNEIASFHEAPEHIWHSPMKARQNAVLYEETEKFYSELRTRLERLLSFKVRDYVVKSLQKPALDYRAAYEKFMDCRIKEDKIALFNILAGLDVLVSQADCTVIAILCEPMQYSALFSALKKEKELVRHGITLNDIDITALLDKMKPFTQKSMMMQHNYEIALNILGLSFTTAKTRSLAQ